jgi:hypothetical protein
LGKSSGTVSFSSATTGLAEEGNSVYSTWVNSDGVNVKQVAKGSGVITKSTIIPNSATAVISEMSGRSATIYITGGVGDPATLKLTAVIVALDSVDLNPYPLDNILNFPDNTVAISLRFHPNQDASYISGTSFFYKFVSPGELVPSGLTEIQRPPDRLLSLNQTMNSTSLNDTLAIVSQATRNLMDLSVFYSAFAQSTFDSVSTIPGSKLYASSFAVLGRRDKKAEKAYSKQWKLGNLTYSISMDISLNCSIGHLLGADDVQRIIVVNDDEGCAVPQPDVVSDPPATLSALAIVLIIIGVLAGIAFIVTTVTYQHRRYKVTGSIGWGAIYPTTTTLAQSASGPLDNSTYLS